MNIKDKEQKRHLSAWKKNSFRGTSIAYTGVGKTRMGVKAIVELYKVGLIESALVITPRRNLNEREWPKEFEAYGAKEYINKVEIVCIQTAYRWVEQHFDLVVVDEVHTTLSSKYRNFYEFNSYTFLYCLTATLPKDKEYRDYLNSIAPVICRTTQKRAEELQLVSPVYTFNVGVPFTIEEGVAYKLNELSIEKVVAGLVEKRTTDLLPEDNEQAFNIATFALQSRDFKKTRLATQYFRCLQLRKKICFNAKNKIIQAKNIIDFFDEEKTLIFCETIEFAEELHKQLGKKSILFHSKLNKKDNMKKLELFDKDPNVRVLTSVKALNMGLNVPDCTIGICIAGTSTYLDDTQRKGRTGRFKKDKISLYFNMFIPNTQEYKWVNRRTWGKPNVYWLPSIEKALTKLKNNGKVERTVHGRTNVFVGESLHTSGENKENGKTNKNSPTNNSKPKKNTKV